MLTVVYAWESLKKVTELGPQIVVYKEDKLDDTTLIVIKVGEVDVVIE